MQYGTNFYGGLWPKMLCFVIHNDDRYSTGLKIATPEDTGQLLIN
jgi:hypothetical protein